MNYIMRAQSARMHGPSAARSTAATNGHYQARFQEVRSHQVLKVREAPFALRVVQRKEGQAAIIYRRRPDANGHDRLQRVAAISPLAFTAGLTLLRNAVSKSQSATAKTNGLQLHEGHFYALNQDWGARLACFGLVAAGLRDAERLGKAGNHFVSADAAEAAWWLGFLTRDDNLRALRALRILVEAVE